MTRAPILLLAALLLMAASPHHTPARHAAPRAPETATVALQEQPGTEADRTARKLAAEDLADARARGDKPLVFVGTADLGGERPALFVQLQSKRECGSAGCSVSAFGWEHGRWARILDGAIGPISISRTKSRGRYDLITKDDHFVWTGSAYRSTSPAPQIDLRPRPPRPSRR